MIVVLLPECGGVVVCLGVVETRVSSCLFVLSTRVLLIYLLAPIFIGDQAIRSLWRSDIKFD